MEDIDNIPYLIQKEEKYFIPIFGLNEDSFDEVIDMVEVTDEATIQFFKNRHLIKYDYDSTNKV